MVSSCNIFVRNAKKRIHLVIDSFQRIVRHRRAQSYCVDRPVSVVVVHSIVLCRRGLNDTIFVTHPSGDWPVARSCGTARLRLAGNSRPLS